MDGRDESPRFVAHRLRVRRVKLEWRLDLLRGDAAARERGGAGERPDSEGRRGEGEARSSGEQEGGQYCAARQPHRRRRARSVFW